MSSKIIYSFLVAVLIVSYADSQSHDLRQGTKLYLDGLLYRVNHWKMGIPFIKRSTDIVFPLENQPAPNFITAVNILDQETDGSGGFPTITAGGVGQNTLGLQEWEAWAGAAAAGGRLCGRLRGLTAGQRRLCRRHGDHMPALGGGAKLAITECQHQFRDRRWNCTVARGDASVFGAATRIASRETAFAYAVTAAGAALGVARACRDGRLASCGCSRAPRPAHLHKDWVWGGCGDNLEYGYRFTEDFIDIRERERKVKRGSREQGRALMNRHNNEAGRRAVIKKSRVTCKCHGVSGSCSLITCWQQLASFREIGDYLRDKYDGATEVRVSRRGKLRLGDPRYSLPTAQDLVYLEESPNYCVRDDTLGSLGTSGRVCNRTSAGVDGCALLCCGRGYNTMKSARRERCECKFHWCCYVECKTCVNTVDIHTCK